MMRTWRERRAFGVSFFILFALTGELRKRVRKVATYLCFGRNVGAHASVSEMRDSAEVAIFYSGGFEWTETDDMLGLACHALDHVVGGCLRWTDWC